MCYRVGPTCRRDGITYRPVRHRCDATRDTASARWRGGVNLGGGPGVETATPRHRRDILKALLLCASNYSCDPYSTLRAAAQPPPPAAALASSSTTLTTSVRRASKRTPRTPSDRLRSTGRASIGSRRSSPQTASTATGSESARPTRPGARRVHGSCKASPSHSMQSTRSMRRSTPNS